MARHAYGVLLARICADQQSTPRAVVLHRLSNTASADLYARLLDHGNFYPPLPGERSQLGRVDKGLQPQACSLEVEKALKA